MNEAWRYLDRRRRQGLCGQATPVVVLQDDSFGATDAITICAFTTDEIEAPLFRLPVEPNGKALG
jgi:mRNA-degrading endonuclease toxin of MazEF toxin-antitoxin module